MALFATSYCLRSISRCNQQASISSTSTKYGANTNASTGASKLKSKMDMFPIYILVGFTGGAVFLAVRSVSQQLFHHPGVQVNKSNRSMMPEVDTPDVSLASGDKFLTRSVLRKVGHIQKRDAVVSMDRAPDATATHRSNESTNLKTVGVEPNKTNLASIFSSKWCVWGCIEDQSPNKIMLLCTFMLLTKHNIFS